jgi:hypothetical protein
MPDVYASIESAEDAVQERLAEFLELRAADAALKREARRRVAAGEFLGHIAYASLIGRRP